MVVIEAIRKVAGTLLVGGWKQATAYVAPDLVVKATGRHKPRANSRTIEMVVTVGKPNYAEREFIRQAKLAGEKFPISKTQLKRWKG